MFRPQVKLLNRIQLLMKRRLRISVAMSVPPQILLFLQHEQSCQLLCLLSLLLRPCTLPLLSFLCLVSLPVFSHKVKRLLYLYVRASRIPLLPSIFVLHTAFEIGSIWAGTGSPLEYRQPKIRSIFEYISATMNVVYRRQECSIFWFALSFHPTQHCYTCSAIMMTLFIILDPPSKQLIMIVANLATWACLEFEHFSI